jgi:hypothetical protein
MSKPIHPALTGDYDTVDEGDLVMSSHGTDLGILVEVLGFYHAKVLWEDGLVTVGSRHKECLVPAARKITSRKRGELYYTAKDQRLRESYKVWHSVEEAT